MYETHVTYQDVDERVAAVERGAMGEGVMCAVGRPSECRWERCVHQVQVHGGLYVTHWRIAEAATTWHRLSILDRLVLLWRRVNPYGAPKTERERLASLWNTRP